MFKYCTFLLVFTLFQSNIQAAPTNNNDLEDEINLLIDTFVPALSKYKSIIDDILSEIINHENERIQTNNDYDNLFNNIQLNAKKGDSCSNNVLMQLKSKDPKICPTADDLVQTAGKMITSTTEIITGSVHSFYVIFADHTTCKDMNGFKCFLAKFHKAHTTVHVVVDNLVNYVGDATKLVGVYKDYFSSECKQVKQHIQKHLEMFEKCNTENVIPKIEYKH